MARVAWRRSVLSISTSAISRSRFCSGSGLYCKFLCSRGLQNTSRGPGNVSFCATCVLQRGLFSKNRRSGLPGLFFIAGRMPGRFAMTADNLPHCRTPFSFAKSLLAAVLAAALASPFGLTLPAASAAPAPSANEKKQSQDPVLKGLPITELSEDEAILHALNRLAYGPRPGDVERIKQMGLAKWIDQQLHPESIDDHAMEARLEQYPTLKMSSAKLIEEYPRPKQAVKQEQKAERAGRRSDQAAAVIARDWNRPPSAQNMPPETETNAPPPSSAPAE